FGGTTANFFTRRATATPHGRRRRNRSRSSASSRKAQVDTRSITAGGERRGGNKRRRGRQPQAAGRWHRLSGRRDSSRRRTPGNPSMCTSIVADVGALVCLELVKRREEIAEAV
ncbi:unnamed protein product, partial [Ectocarpus sp. 8 AP-2014]